MATEKVKKIVRVPTPETTLVSAEEAEDIRSMFCDYTEHYYERGAALVNYAEAKARMRAFAKHWEEGEPNFHDSPPDPGEVFAAARAVYEAYTTWWPIENKDRLKIGLSNLLKAYRELCLCLEESGQEVP